MIGFEDPLPIILVIIWNKPVIPFTVRLRRSGYSFRVRSAMDIWSIKETFLNRFYERHVSGREDGDRGEFGGLFRPTPGESAGG